MWISLFLNQKWFEEIWITCSSTTNSSFLFFNGRSFLNSLFKVQKINIKLDPKWTWQEEKKAITDFSESLSCPFNVHSLLTSSQPFISQSPSGPEGNWLLVCSPYITYWHWWPDFWIITSDVSFLNQLFKISDSCQRASLFIIPNCHAPSRHWSKHLHLPPQYLTSLKKDMK